MDLSPYVGSVQAGLTNAAALGDDHSQHVARQLGHALDSATRLALIQALSDASSQISADLAPGSVEVRIVDGEPDFVVTAPRPAVEPTLLMPEPEPAPAPPEPPEPEPADDEPVARISLRLPTSVKERVDQLADADSISTNAWLVRAVLDALQEREQPRTAGSFPFPGAVFGEGGVFGPHGVFGAHGPFGDRPSASRGGAYAGPTPPEPPRFSAHGRSGSVQGWVR